MSSGKTENAVLAAKPSTIVWSGDAIILGAGLAGLTAAVELADKGKSVMLIEAGPVLGREVSREWQTDLPETPLTEELRDLCTDRNACPDGQIDIFTATLAFDRIIEKHEINCLVRAVPARPILNDDGILKGIEITGKSGRQLVQAPLCFDAAPGRIFSRRFLGLPRPAVMSAQRRIYMQGCTIAEAKGIEIPADLKIENNTISMEPAVWPGEALISFSVIPNPKRDSQAELAADTFQTATDIAAHLRHKVEGFKEASMIDTSPDCQVIYETDDPDFSQFNNTGFIPLPADLNAVSGVLNSDLSAVLPSAQAQGDTIQSFELSAAPEWDLSETELPPAPVQVHEPCDVVVAGFGTGGSFAAMAAADEDMSVTVLDPAAQPGGIATAGSIHSYYHGFDVGLQSRYDEMVTGSSASVAKEWAGFHPSAKTAVLARAIKERNVNSLNGHTVFGVVKEGRKVTAVLSVADDGYHMFPCHVAIDGTGDGDLAAAAGADFILGREGDGFPQPFSYTPRFMRGEKVAHHNFDAGWVNPTDSLDYSRAHFVGRLRLWERGPFSEEMHYCSLSTILGLRESRFITGPVRLTFEDFMEGRTYDDTVCGGRAHYDNHAQDFAQESLWAHDHCVMYGMWSQMCEGEVPFRTLYPEAVDGILIACRALSIDHDLHQLLRMQRDLQTTGEICGLAAAMAVKNDTTPDKINISTLQTELKSRGIMPGKPAEPMMKKPVDELLAALGGEETGLAMWRLAKSDETPDWDAFLNNETDDTRRYGAAMAAALHGDASAAIAAELEKTIAARVEEPLGRKMPSRYVSAALALSRIDADKGLAVITELLEEGPVPMDVMLFFRALGMQNRPEAAAPIRAWLKDHADEEIASPLWGVKDGTGVSFRFGVELCAVRELQKLGCRDESHLLEQYLNDPRLPVRQCARRLSQS